MCAHMRVVHADDRKYGADKEEQSDEDMERHAGARVGIFLLEEHGNGGKKMNLRRNTTRGAPESQERKGGNDGAVVL